MDRFEALRKKYQSVVDAITNIGNLEHLHTQDNRLFIGGRMLSQADKNHIWDQIKANYPIWENELICDLTVATAKVVNVTPLTLYANRIEVKPETTADCPFLTSAVVEIGFFAPERPESPYCRVEVKEVKESSTVKVDPDFLRERWPFDWMSVEPWKSLLPIDKRLRNAGISPEWGDHLPLTRPLIVTNNAGQFVDAYRVYGNRRELRQRIKPNMQVRFDVPALTIEQFKAFAASMPFDLWEFRTSQRDQLTGMAITSPLDVDSQVTLDKRPSVAAPVQVDKKPQIINATPLELRLACHIEDLGGDAIERKEGLPHDQRVSLVLPKTEIQNIHVTVQSESTGAELGSFDLLPESSPLTLTPAALGWPPEGLQIIGEKRRSTPAPGDQSFLSHATVRREFSQGLFNGLKNRVLRDIEISGVLLEWSGDHTILRDYYGETSASDIRSMTIYADRMVVSDHLLFPGTNVTVYARELEFSGIGSIDTTPLEISPKAESKYFTKDPENLTNAQAPADEYGTPTYRAADGEKGQRGGAITLYVGRVIDAQRNASTKRLISRGGTGQKGEDGGLKKYVPKEGYPQTHQISTTISAEKFGKFFEDHNRPHSLNNAHERSDYWRWPGEVDWPSLMEVEPLPGVHPQPGNVLNTRKCVAVSLYAYCDEWGGADFKERGFLPSREYKSFRGPDDPPWVTWNEFDKANPGPKPCNGRDAYPGGWPGEGGDGGSIALNVECGSVPQFCDVSPGDPGGPTPSTAGGKPPGPVPAYEMKIVAVRKDRWHIKESDRKPLATLTDVTGKPGQAAKGRSVERNPLAMGRGPNETRRSQAQKGSITFTNIQDTSWAQPASVGAVVRYAQTSYRNGFRKEAADALQPYFALVGLGPGKLQASDSQLGLLFARISSMRDNLASNLDYYGNPPNWVPRLNALTNLQILTSVRNAAYGTYYFAEKMLNDYDALVDARSLSEATSEALKDELKAAQKSLATAYEGLPKALAELDGVQQEIGPVKDGIEDLRKMAFEKTQSKVLSQRVFSASMQILGGVAKSLPVGQPFLGLAGSAFGAASDIDWNAPDPLATARKSIDSFSNTVTDFTKNKKDQVAALVGQNLRDVGQQKEDEVTNLTRRLADEEKKSKDAADATETEWNKFKVQEQTRLAKQIENTEAAIKDLAAAPKLEKQENETEEAYKKRVEEYNKKEAEKAGEKRKADAFLVALKQQRDGLAPEVKKVTDALLQYQLRQTELELEASQLAASQNVNLKDAAGQVHGSQVPPSVQQKMDTQKDLANLPALAGEKIAADRKLQDQKKLIEQREKTAKEVMNNFDGLGSGLGMIGNGIVSLATPLTADDPTWKRLAHQMLVDDPELSKAGKELNEKMQGMLDRKRRAADKLLFLRQQASSSAATIASNLGGLAALSQQRQSLNQGLDPAVQGYLLETKERAKDALAESIYWFVKSFQYEFLTDVDDSFYNFDSWTATLRAQESAKQLAALPKDEHGNLLDKDGKRLQSPPPRDKGIVLSKKEFEDIGDEVFRAEMFKLGNKLLPERQRRAPKSKDDYKSCVLERSKAADTAWMNEMLDSLLHRGEISFNFVEHFNKGSYSLDDARVFDVDLTQFGIETDDPNLSLTLRIRHSGRSVIGRGKERDRAYYAFESGRNDDPIRWQFVYNRPKNNNESGISRSQLEDSLDENIKAMLPGKLPKFTEYSPGLFSDYVLQITDLTDYKRRAIKAINKIVMDVAISQA